MSFCGQEPADTKLHFIEVHTSKLEISAKKRRLAALDQLSHSDSADSELSQPTLSQSFSKATKADTDASVARFFYAEGVAFQKVGSPYFAEMCKAIGKFGSSYNPPTP